MKVNVLIDSSGWIEFLSDGKLAGKYSEYIEKASKENYFTPSIVLFEVYKQISRRLEAEKALKAIAHIIAHTTTVNLDESLSLEAADASLRFGLSMADAIIRATAEKTNSQIITSDRHFKQFKEAVLIK